MLDESQKIIKTLLLRFQQVCISPLGILRTLLKLEEI